MIKTNKLKETSEWFTRAGNGTKIRFTRRCLAFLERYINTYLWVNDSFVLLSHFMKKTQKTPKREIEKAKRLYADLKKYLDVIKPQDRADPAEYFQSRDGGW